MTPRNIGPGGLSGRVTSIDVVHSNADIKFVGNDGGMNITKDGGKNWRLIGNLAVAQFYHISVDKIFHIICMVVCKTVTLGNHIKLKWRPYKLILLKTLTPSN
jgi:photosystem II stability/assembly factor-like uncharacterized protein